MLERFPEARERWQKAFRYVLVDEYQDTNHAQYRLLQLLAASTGTCGRRRPRPGDLRAGAAPTSATSSSSSSDFPGARVDHARAELPLDEHDPRRRERGHREQPRAQGEEPLAELGEGEPVRVVEVEDEHAEARFVAAEIAGLVEQGYSGREIAVVYRTNAQSRVLEDVLVRQGVAYQVIGGPRFYERAEIKDAIAYLQVDRQPVRRRLAARGSRTGRGAASATRRSRGCRRYADGAGHLALGGARAAPRRPGSATAPLKAVRAFRTLIQSLHVGRARARGAGAARARARAVRATIAALEAERTIEAQGRIENLQELVGVAREWQEQTPEPNLSAFLQEISLYSDQDAIRGEGGHVTLMTLHNAKGLEFKRRLHDRHGGGDLPALALDRGERASRRSGGSATSA